MTDDASNIVAFLIARIEKDERIADHVASVSPTSDTRFCLWATQFAFDADRVIVAADYQRVIADCAAKRRIVDDFRATRSRTAKVLDAVPRQLASAYQDHPDYREEWRV